MVAIWFSQPLWSLPLPLPLPLWPPLSLPLFLPFFPSLGARSLPVCGATVKKGVSWPGVESSQGRVCLSLVLAQSGIDCARRGSRGGHHHLRSLRCIRNCVSLPALYNSAWGWSAYEGSHSCVRINKCPARVLYRLKLKQQSPQARHTAAYLAVSGVPGIWVDQFALQHRVAAY